MMRRPIYKAMFDVAAQQNKSVGELVNSMSLAEFYQWLAYYKTQDPDWVEKFNLSEEARRQKEMSAAEHSKYVLKQLGFI